MLHAQSSGATCLSNTKPMSTIVFASVLFALTCHSKVHSKIFMECGPIWREQASFITCNYYILVIFHTLYICLMKPTVEPYSSLQLWKCFWNRNIFGCGTCTTVITNNVELVFRQTGELLHWPQWVVLRSVCYSSSGFKYHEFQISCITSVSICILLIQKYVLGYTY